MPDEPKSIANVRMMRAIVDSAATSEGAEKIVREFVAGVAQHAEAPVSLIVAMANLALEARVNELIDAGRNL